MKIHNLCSPTATRKNDRVSKLKLIQMFFSISRVGKVLTGSFLVRSYFFNEVHLHFTISNFFYSIKFYNTRYLSNATHNTSRTNTTKRERLWQLRSLNIGKRGGVANNG